MGTVIASGLTWIRRRLGLAGAELAHKVATLAGGTAMAQVISLAAYPVVTRLYTPADYGVLAVTNSVIGLLAVVATLQFQVAIPLPVRDKQAWDLLRVCLSLAALVAGLIGVFGGFIAGPFFDCIGVPEATQFWWFVPAGVGGLAVYNSLYHWQLRCGEYSRLARTKLWQAGGMTVASIGVGLVSPGPFGLLLGNLLFHTAGIGGLWHAMRNRSERNSAWSWRRIWETAREYRTFALFGGPAALLNTAGLLLPPLLIGNLYGLGASGAFGLAFRLVSIPVTLVGAAASQVFLAEASRLMDSRQAEVWNLFRKFSRKLLPPSLLLVLGGAIAPLVFPLVFGANWHTAGHFAGLLAIACGAQLFVSPISNIAVLRKRQGAQCGLDALRVLIVCLSFWGAHRLGASVTQAVGCYAVAMALLYLCYYLFYRHLARGLAHGKSSQPNSSAVNPPVQKSDVSGNRKDGSL